MPLTMITRMRPAAASGHRHSASRLLPQVYEQLHVVAQRRMAAERKDHTLQPTALVHEAYLRLAGTRDVPWAGRAHFYAAASQAMRQVLVDHARARAATKRGAEVKRAAMDLTCLPDLDSDSQSAGFLILDDAMSRLEWDDPEAAEVVRLRFFAGLTVEQTATALGISSTTVKRHWVFARAWLKVAIDNDRA